MIEKLTLSDYYHQKTKHSRFGIGQKGKRLDWSAQPTVFKDYPAAEVTALPEPGTQLAMSIGDAIDKTRKPVSNMSPKAISIQDLSQLLFMANGVTGELRYPGLTYYLRAAPSAGALYPTVTYLLVQNVEGITPGLYHYAVKEHQLHRLKSSDTLSKELAALVDNGHLVRHAPLTFIYTSIFFRMSWKYGQRSYRYCCLDAGHVAVQAELAASALGFGSKSIARFDDDKVNKLVGMDGQQEAVMLIVPVGRDVKGPEKIPKLMAFASSSLQNKDTSDLISLIHSGTSLDLTEGPSRSFNTRSPTDKSYPDYPVIKLPRTFLQGDDIGATIIRRRSARRWADENMTLSEFSSVLYYAYGIKDGEKQFLDQSVQDNHSLNLYVLVNDVEGLSPGIYYYRRFEHALSQIRRENLQRSGYAAALFQEVVGGAQAVFIMTIDLKRLGHADADRGYRYACIEAGMLGGRIYLQTVGQGLGCCGIGAFFDDAVSELIDVSPKEELVIYMAAIGTKDHNPG